MLIESWESSLLTPTGTEVRLRPSSATVCAKAERGRRGGGKTDKTKEKKKRTLVGPDVPLVLAAVLEEVGVAVGTLLRPLHHHRSALQGGRVCPAHIHTVSVAEPPDVHGSVRV